VKLPDEVSEAELRQLRRRNLIVGCLVGAVVLGIVAAAMWRFTTDGLPKDRTVLERLEQHDSMHEGASDANKVRTEQ